MSGPHTHAIVVRLHEHVGFPAHEHRWMLQEEAADLIRKAEARADGLKWPDLCPDCGHHIHRPQPCGWTFGVGRNERPCPCPTEARADALDVEKAAREFIEDHDGDAHSDATWPCDGQCRQARRLRAILAVDLDGPHDHAAGR